MTKKYYYSIGEKVEPSEAVESFESETSYEWPEYAGYVIEQMADEYETNHDGWEAQWPLDFFVYDEKGDFLGTTQVAREFYPSYSSGRLYDANGDRIE